MDIFDVELTQTVNRQEVATRLRRLAKMLFATSEVNQVPYACPDGLRPAA